MKCTNAECGAENAEGTRFCECCGVDLKVPLLKVVCPHCGRGNKTGYKFCRGCGKPPVVERVCPHCGAKGFSEDDSFCDECGTRLSAVGKPYANCQVGEHFFLGSYPQGENGEVKPVEWRVLARESGRMLVIAECGLNAKACNEAEEGTDWSRCTLRTWLNGAFMEKVFNAEERRLLMEVTLHNPPSPAEWHNVPGGPDTSDKVFLLSLEEAERYFKSESERCCKPTAYALRHGAYALDEEVAKELGVDAQYTGNCWWWLRTPVVDAYSAAAVLSDGSFRERSVNYDYGAVRPAVFLVL